MEDWGIINLLLENKTELLSGERVCPEIPGEKIITAGRVTIPPTLDKLRNKDKMDERVVGGAYAVTGSLAVF